MSNLEKLRYTLMLAKKIRTKVKKIKYRKKAAILEEWITKFG